MLQPCLVLQPIVQRVELNAETWLHFPNIVPGVCILRATTADEHGNLTYEHEGAYLGGLDQAIATRNHGGRVRWGKRALHAPVSVVEVASAHHRAVD